MAESSTPAEGAGRSRGNATKVHDNRAVKDFLSPVSTLALAYQDHPWLDHILTGCAALKTEGQNSTRPLRKSLVYLLIGVCDVITVEAVNEATGHRYSNAQASRYAALARVASKAVLAHIQSHGLAPRPCDFNFSPIERTLEEPLSGDRTATHGPLPADDFGLIPQENLQGESLNC